MAVIGLHMVIRLHIKHGISNVGPQKKSYSDFHLVVFLLEVRIQYFLQSEYNFILKSLEITYIQCVQVIIKYMQTFVMGQYKIYCRIPCGSL